MSPGGREFSALDNLQQLHIGIVKRVTGDGFADGLVSSLLPFGDVWPEINVQNLVVAQNLLSVYSPASTVPQHSSCVPTALFARCLQG